MKDFFEFRELLESSSIADERDALASKYQKLVDSGKKKEADKVWKDMSKLQKEKNALTKKAKMIGDKRDALASKYQKLVDSGKKKEADKAWKEMSKLQKEKNDIVKKIGENV